MLRRFAPTLTLNSKTVPTIVLDLRKKPHVDNTRTKKADTRHLLPPTQPGRRTCRDCHHLLLPLCLGCSCFQVDSSHQCKKASTNKLTCQERLANANKLTYEARKKSLQCKSDGDCTIFSLRTGCTGSCPRAVAKSQLDTLKAAVLAANKKWCATYRADKVPIQDGQM